MLYADSDMVFQSWRAFGGGDDVPVAALSDLLPGACLRLLVMAVVPRPSRPGGSF